MLHVSCETHLYYMKQFKSYTHGCSVKLHFSQKQNQGMVTVSTGHKTNTFCNTLTTKQFWAMLIQPAAKQTCYKKP
jgi:CRISPR/Cas system-associated protein endoribonuclease Cas2